MSSKNKTFSWYFLAALAFSFSGFSLADQEPNEYKPELAKTVGQMLMIDAAVAHKYEQDRLFAAMGKKSTPVVATKAAPVIQPIQAPEPKPVQASTVEVIKEKPPVILGIFGINDNLFADVQIDSERVRFQKGSSNPISGGNKENYKLVSINVPCVVLIKENKKTSVCLEKDGI